MRELDQVCRALADCEQQLLADGEWTDTVESILFRSGNWNLTIFVHFVHFTIHVRLGSVPIPNPHACRCGWLLSAPSVCPSPMKTLGWQGPFTGLGWGSPDARVSTPDYLRCGVGLCMALPRFEAASPTGGQVGECTREGRAPASKPFHGGRPTKAGAGGARDTHSSPQPPQSPKHSKSKGAAHTRRVRWRSHTRATPCCVQGLKCTAHHWPRVSRPSARPLTRPSASLFPTESKEGPAAKWFCVPGRSVCPVQVWNEGRGVQRL